MNVLQEIDRLRVPGQRGESSAKTDALVALDKKRNQKKSTKKKPARKRKKRRFY